MANKWMCKKSKKGIDKKRWEVEYNWRYFHDEMLPMWRKNFKTRYILP